MTATLGKNNNQNEKQTIRQKTFTSQDYLNSNS